MKTIATFLTLFGILFLTLNAEAQRRNAPEPSRDGYWVVESMPPHHQSTVMFYSTDHQLMYREVIDGKPLNIRRPRVVARLNAVLEQAHQQYAANRRMMSNQNWVAAKLK